MAIKRARLELEAAALNVPLHPNDSVLDQRVLFALKNLAASTTATTVAPSASAKQAVAGAANV